MRKNQQQQALDFVKLLEQAHDELKTLIKQQNIASARGLLEDCQEGAIELGNLIETTEGEQCKTIAVIEEYCEQTYLIYEKLVQDENVNADKVYKILRRLVIKIENSIKNDIPIRREVVFLPYKASMWDSLESVWKAADEDELCDAYVIPIPYYDKNPDGSFKEMHYEGDQYPEYVPVTDYEDYDFESRKPDMIFIHNPYDEFNFVTSVHPFFYAKNLKQFTQMLIYIPYFVMVEVSPNDKYAVHGIEHHCTVPGVFYADYVVVQSENIRRIFIDVLTETFGKESKPVWEKKMLGLGSPKMEKVLNIGKENEEIPKEWLKVIQKPDGSRKKVILYNTSVGALLINDEKMLAKIQSVLKIMKENKDEAVLLWRPHPLMKSTISSMRPELREGYQEMVDEYIHDGWGIYDDTSEFHAAFAVSDAYYGDYSSLVPLYLATGKPLLQHNPDIIDYAKRFVTRKLYYDGQYVWATALEFNGLFRIDSNAYEIAYVGAFPDEKSEGYYLFHDIVEHNSKLYFCPYNAKHIAVYDKAASEFQTIPLRENIREMEKKFFGMSAYGKYIYLQGSNVHAVAQLDTETNEIFYIEDWVEEVQRRQSGHYDMLIRRGCIVNDSLYYFCHEARGLLTIRLHDLSYEFIPLQYSGANNFIGNADDSEVLWLSPFEKGFVSCFDPQTAALTELVQVDRAVGLCKVKSYIYCFSRKELWFYRIHAESHEVTKYPIDQRIYNSCPVGDKIFLTTNLTGELYILDTVSLKITKTELQIDDKHFPEHKTLNMLEDNKGSDQCAWESAYLNLKNLLEMDTADNDKHPISDKSNCGAKIYEYMRGRIG